MAMLKEENKYAKVPLILQYKYNRYTKRWTMKYLVQSMDEWISFESFFKKNADTILVEEET